MSYETIEAKTVLRTCHGINYRAGVIKLRNALEQIDHAVEMFSTRTTEDLQRSGDLGILSELRALRAQTENNLRKAQELKEKGRAFLTNYKMAKKSNSKVPEPGPTASRSNNAASRSSEASVGSNSAPSNMQNENRSPPPTSRSPPNHETSRSPPNQEMGESYREEMVRQEREIMRLRQQIEDFKLNDHKQKQAHAEQMNNLMKINESDRQKGDEMYNQVREALKRKEAELNQLNAEKEELERQNLKLTKENSNVDMAAETMQRISSETDNLRRENQRLAKSLETTLQEKTSLFQDLTKARTEVARSQAENDGLAAQQRRTTPRSPTGDKGLTNDEKKLLFRVKEVANNCHNLASQLAEQTRSIFKTSAYAPLNDSMHTMMKEKQVTEVTLKKKIDSILYTLNPVNQVMALSDPIVPEKQGSGLTPKIKKLLNHRQSLLVQVEDLQGRVRELLLSKKDWSRRIDEVEEEKSMMLGKLRETISSLITEKQQETSAREEIEEHCMELQEGLQIFREKFREQDTQLRSYQNNIENYEKVKEHSEVIAEATSIQSIGIKKENDKLRRDCNEYQDRIQAMLTNKEGLTRQIRAQAQLIDEMKLEQIRMARRITSLESIEGDHTEGLVTGVEAEELAETVEMLSNENDGLRKEKYALLKQVDEFDDKLNNLHMMICDLENEKTELSTQNEILKTTNKSNLQLPMIDPSDPRVTKRLDQFGLLPPPPGQSVLEGIFEFLFPFLFEEEVL